MIIHATPIIFPTQQKGTEEIINIEAFEDLCAHIKRISSRLITPTDGIALYEMIQKHLVVIQTYEPALASLNDLLNHMLDDPTLSPYAAAITFDALQQESAIFMQHEGMKPFSSANEIKKLGEKEYAIKLENTMQALDLLEMIKASNAPNKFKTDFATVTDSIKLALRQLRLVPTPPQEAVDTHTQGG